MAAYTFVLSFLSSSDNSSQTRKAWSSKKSGKFARSLASVSHFCSVPATRIFFQNASKVGPVFPPRNGRTNTSILIAIVCSTKKKTPEDARDKKQKSTVHARCSPSSVSAPRCYRTLRVNTSSQPIQQTLNTSLPNSKLSLFTSLVVSQKTKQHGALVITQCVLCMRKVCRACVCRMCMTFLHSPTEQNKT